jgi:hypothetical protein
MRKHLKILFILLVFAFCAPLLANGSEISNQFRAALDGLPQEMASPFAKAGLESTVFQFFRARVNLAPNQYELKAEFQDTFIKSFDAFRILLYSSDLQLIREKVSKDDIALMEKSYSKHEKGFADFSNTVSQNVIFFRQIAKNTILRAQMYYALILSGFNKNQWLSARKFTHIWPFCD